MRKALVSALVVLVMGVISASEARAAFINSFVGNSGVDSGGSFNGWVSFAVYENTGGSNWLTDLGVDVAPVSGSTLTGSEPLVYFYEIVRDSTAADVIVFNVPTGKAAWTGIGALEESGASTDGVVFNDATGGGPAVAVTATGANNQIGPNPGAGGTDLTGILDTTPFVGNSAAVIPDSVSVAGFAGNFVFDYTAVPFNSFGPSEHSTVIALATVDVSAEISTLPDGGLSGIGTSSDVAVPVANPEPTSLALLSLVLVGGASGSWWRRRRSKGEAEQSNG